MIHQRLPEFFGSEVEQISLKRASLDQSSNILRVVTADFGTDTWIIMASYKYRRKSMDQAWTSNLRSHFEVFAENFAEPLDLRLLHYS